MDEQDICSLFGKNIKRYRNRFKWSQEILAGKLDISINFLSNIENGKAWISPKTVAKLSHALNIEPYELFKPEEALKGDIKTVLEKFSNDISFSLNQTIEKMYTQYTKDVD
jgi:transcriptional regulator with XRE-family HTH domain